MNNGITDKLNSAQAIWQVGKGDGTYLGVLNVDGSVRDWDFFQKWVNGPDTGKTKVYNKLVRDRIPEIIRMSGTSFNTRQLNNEDYIKELKNKAVEELNEFMNSETRQEVGEELADLLEVMHSLAEYNGYSFSDIEEIRKQKAEARGRFNNRIYLVDVEG